MVAMNMNCPTRVLSATTSSSSITLTPTQADQSSVIIYNSGNSPVALISAKVATAAVFPVAGTPQNCCVVGPGFTSTYTKNIGDNIISCIASSGTATVFVQIGPGE